MSGFSHYFALNRNVSDEIFMALQAKKQQKSEQHCSDDFGP